MVDNTFFKERMVFCQHGELAEYPCGLPHNQPYKAKCDTKIEEVQRYMVGRNVLSGEYHLEKVQPMSEDQKYGHKRYGAIIPFGTSLHQDEQRSHKVDNQVEIKNTHVRSIKTRFEINRFFRDIGIPDQHELVEPE